MPARAPVSSVIQLNLKYELGDKVAENLIYFQFTPAGPSNLDFVEAVASAAVAAVNAEAGQFPASTSFTGVTVTDLTSDIAPVTVATSGTAGTRVGGILPANVAVLASYSIARRYRGGHARNYLPWFSDADVLTPQTWVGASVTNASIAWTNILDSIPDVSAGGFTVGPQVQVSYMTSVGGVPTPRVTPLVNPINFSGIDAVMASQRRRDGRH